MKAEQADREETEENDVDDIVEDFQFSDLDEWHSSLSRPI